MYKHEIEERLNKYAPKTKWEQGVKDTALDLIENIENDDNVMIDELEERLLNNAGTWEEYSECGMPLAYTADIIRRYCDNEQAKYAFEHFSDDMTNWQHVQALALEQASTLIHWVVALGY